jgi:DEAD/DEAH box helicase domain-containing protein
MLPLQQAYEIRESIISYLRATFNFQDKDVHKAFYDFISDPNEGIFKGPYLSLHLPFVKAEGIDSESLPLEILPSWPPYDHQIKSWRRLGTLDSKKPEPTLITTGTGSGKTEAFLYPMLDYCYQNRFQAGIKVIILYPMNALATDQAKRLATTIYEDDRLKGVVSAGLFIGEGRDAAKYPKTMGPENIIENRNSIVDSPPDILLTNFKMLDYGLMRHNFHNLWTHNFVNPSLLRFLVLDELHTYDGAQGTDVANLIRRLKLKLQIPDGQLCPIGTSATMGSGAESTSLLCEYASRVFGEEINSDAVISETRITLTEFFNNRGRDDLNDQWIGMNSLRKSALQVNDNYQEYLKRQYNLWGLPAESSPSEIGQFLRNKLIVYDLLSVCRNQHITVESLVQKLNDCNTDFHQLPQWDEDGQFDPKEAVILSILALIAEAKTNDTKKPLPLLFSQVQIWIRELSGVLRDVAPQPKFTWKDAVDNNNETKALPPYFCRECGASGWIGIKHDNKERLEQDIKDIYSKYFSNHKHIYFANESRHPKIDEYEPTDDLVRQIHPQSLEFITSDSNEGFGIVAYRKLNTRGFNDHVCPECNTHNTLAIIGTRVATLSSVAISQSLATDLNYQEERERKVLAFTNSVQDAAHQAGFIDARNYRFTFRSSVQKIINKQVAPISLVKLFDEFASFWKINSTANGKDSFSAYYHRFYPSDYRGVSSPISYKDKEKYENHFKEEYDLRVKWELFSEFGYNARIGRTLEKTGSSAVFMDYGALENVWILMEPWLKDNNLQIINQSQFLKFLEILLYRVRVRGGISHPYLEKFRSSDLKIWDLNWMRDERHFLNQKFGPKSRLPKLITTVSETRSLLDSTFTNRTNWFHSYYRKSFQMASSFPDLVNEFFQKLCDALLQSELFDMAQAGDLINYAINPAKVQISNKVSSFVCQVCGNEISSASKREHIEGAFCQNYRCIGQYQFNDRLRSLNYYQLVYNRNRSPRIYAGDHTGLLTRKDRENIEIDFKTRPNFNSKNALVATSTLEMGIDIGDLNIAFNNSVPPLPTNFLQRVGRAGRKDGTALIVNFVQSSAHDLYYFKKPSDMMTGEITTPGCYLEAKEILKRHFFAFCIDSWTKKNPKENTIPSHIRFLKIDTCNLNSAEFFMNMILNYVKSSEEDLFQYFSKQYNDLIDPEVLSELRLTMINESFYQQHKAVFVKLQQEVKSIKEKRNEIDKRIRINKLAINDPERQELEQEKKSLWGIIVSINKRTLLEHLTNVGVLPNYAFPETGVTMNAKVLGKKAEASTVPPVHKEYEIVRPANQALRELAPDNHFYSQGYKFLVSGVETFNWADEGQSHFKRFCSNCDHIEIESISEKGNCPKCGDESWGASSNTHHFARMGTVKSYNNQEKATLNDSSEDRNPLIYSVDKHFKFDSASSHGSLVIKSVPFGIEYVKNVRITDVNLGKADVVNARKLKINGREVPVHGFVTCKFCGKSTSNFHQKDYKYHYGYCKHKERSYENTADDVYEEVFFFREIQSEALKILLPTQEVNSDEEIQMFMAGISLGLRKYYKGNPQHIGISRYKEFNKETQRFDKYLVLFDTIPGGTGYLDKLFDKNSINELIFRAYEAIMECSCQFQNKDGCYRCIYTYSNQYYQANLSRSGAESQFEKLVNLKDGWEQQTQPLNSLTRAGNIEESELEDRFIRSLKNVCTKRPGWKFIETNDDGTISYLMEIDSQFGKSSYHIRPQIDLGPSDGIKYHTRTDFLIICTGFESDIENTNTANPNSIPKIAVYLDGYQYHASSDHNRFTGDLLKRDSINSNQQYTTWTLTWSDLELFDLQFIETKDGSSSDSLAKRLGEPGFSQTRNTLKQAINENLIPVDEGNNNLERLLILLQYPNRDSKFKKSWSSYLSYFQKEIFKPSFVPENFETLLNLESPLLPETYCISQKTLNGFVAFQGFESKSLFNSRTIINIKTSEVHTVLKTQETKLIEKEEWILFWQYFNLIQLFEFKIDPAEINEFESPVSNQEVQKPIENIATLIECFEEKYQPVLKAYLSKKDDTFSSNDEVLLNNLLDGEGKVIAEAELCLHDSKLVINPLSDSCKEIFLQQGYRILNDSDIKTIEI